MRLLLATRNPFKIREISALLTAAVEVVGLDAFAALPEVDEDQPTLEGNARKKARAAARGSGLWALADDTGLEVEALGGAPGVYSARYAGPGCDFAANNRKLLSALKSHASKNRKAVFRTVMALCGPNEKVIMEQGLLEGSIAESPQGGNGFGYDPIFYVPAAGKTLAQMEAEEKNALSHRADALKKMLPHIKKLALMFACCGGLVLAPAAWAGRTEPGQETIWDQIMASQAHRDLRDGSQYLDAKQYDLAVKEFTRAVVANPRDPMAHMLLGAAYYWNGQVDRSLESYRKSLELDPNNAHAYMLTGISLAWKGDLKGSYAAFKRAAELDGSRSDIQMNLGSVEESLGMMPEALAHFRAAAALSPKEPLYHFQLGMLYRKLGRDQDAAQSLSQAIKLYSEFEDALLELGAIDERRGDTKSAIYHFKKAVALKSRDSVARFRLGRLYLMTGDPRRAREIFADSFHLTPEEGGSGLQLSVAYTGGKRESAKNQAAPASNPLPEKNSNDPLEVFSRNLERIPLDQSAIMQVDVVFVPRPKLVKASPESRSALKKALQQELDPDRSRPTAVRREYQIRAGNPDQRADQINKLMEDLRAVMRNAPENSDARLGMNLTYKRLAPAGNAAPEAGRDGSLPLTAKVSYQPREVGNDLGLWIIGTGWMALVEEILPEPGEKPAHPDESDWWVSTGLGFATLGDAPRALEAFERACRLDPKNEGALLGRGVAYVMAGDESQAAASYREVLKLYPKNRPAKEGLKWLMRPVSGKKK